MKAFPMRILSAVVLAALAGALHAETYDGAHPLTSGAQRSEVSTQAHAAARAGNSYGGIATPADRAAVRAEAIKEAHDPVTGVDRRNYLPDQAPSQGGRTKTSSAY